MKTLALIALLLLTPACGNGGTFVPPPPPAGGTDFVEFVKARFAETSDQTDPVPLNGISFENRLIDDETAFDDLLP